MNYAGTASCLDQHTHAIVGDPQFGILQPQCRVELVTLTTFWGDPYTYHNNIIGTKMLLCHPTLYYRSDTSFDL